MLRSSELEYSDAKSVRHASKPADLLLVALGDKKSGLQIVAFQSHELVFSVDKVEIVRQIAVEASCDPKLFFGKAL
jgi:hypothetical protein